MVPRFRRFLRLRNIQSYRLWPGRQSHQTRCSYREYLADRQEARNVCDHRSLQTEKIGKPLIGEDRLHRIADGFELLDMIAE